MKIVSFGDTHGREFWKQIVNQESDADKYVFIGDYFDSHGEVKGWKQLEVFLDILEFKKANPDKVELLVGNHDYHYWPGVTGTYSGFQADMYYTFQDALKKAEEYLRVIYVSDNNICVHAGITQVWMDTYELKSLDEINELWKYKPRAFGFLNDPAERFLSNLYGDNVWQSPLWVRPQSLIDAGIERYNQIVGHTTQDNLTMKTRDNGDRFYFTDTLGTSKEYLVIDDGEFITKQL